MMNGGSLPRDIEGYRFVKNKVGVDTSTLSERKREDYLYLTETEFAIQSGQPPDNVLLEVDPKNPRVINYYVVDY